MLVFPLNLWLDFVIIPLQKDSKLGRTWDLKFEIGGRLRYLCNDLITKAITYISIQIMWIQTKVYFKNYFGDKVSLNFKKSTRLTKNIENTYLEMEFKNIVGFVSL
jgi:hypothetical protein